MYIPKLRRISDALKELKEIDPDCPLTWYSLRELCLKGHLTTLKYGNSWLINMDELALLFRQGGEIE